MKGWVYVLTNKAMPDIVKIGFSTKHPELRALELDGTGVPHRYDVAYTALVNNPYTVEQNVHSMLVTNHENKEFFRISVNEAISAIKKCINEMSESIFFEEISENNLEKYTIEQARNYEDGNGVARDVFKAKTIYEKLAKENNPEAQGWIGWYYLYDDDANAVYKSTFKLGLEWISKAIENGDKSSINSVSHWRELFNKNACSYEVPFDLGDYLNIVKSLEIAANKGDQNTQFHLGNIYCYGVQIPRDYSKALYWFQKAAEQGHVEARENARTASYELHREKDHK